MSNVLKAIILKTLYNVEGETKAQMYRDLEEMMTERGVPVDHTTIYRWVQKYAPELDKQTRWYRQVPDWQASSWRVDETYIRVGGRWCYL